MRLNPNIKHRQLRKQYDSLKLKEIGIEMYSKQQFGLKIEKEKLGVNSLSFLENFKHLESLSIYNISKDISIITELKNLKQLALCGLTLNNLDFLKSLPNLEYLWIQGSKLKNFNSLKGLKQIKAIKLFRIQKLDNIDFISNMTSLQYINIDNCSNLIEFPDTSKLINLRRVLIDTTKRLKDISQISNAPMIEDLIVIKAKELPIDCFDSFTGHKTLKKILIGIDTKTSKKYKEIEKRIPETLQMKGFYGTENESFELKNTLHNNS